MADLRRRGPGIPGSLDAEEVIDTARTNDFELEEKKDEKDASVVQQEISPVYLEEDGSEVYKLPPETSEDFVTEVIHARDDPTLNPWTVRTLVLGNCCLGCACANAKLLQVLVWPHLELCWQQSIISNPRQSWFRQSSWQLSVIYSEKQWPTLSQGRLGWGVS
jgi:hypothetical protein